MAARRFLFLATAGAALVASAPAHAIDYLSVAQAAVLYDAPSAKAKPLFVIHRGTPVEQVVVVGGWVKVRDARGDLAWIEKGQLSTQRMVIVRGDKAEVRATANDTAALVFVAHGDVVLEWVGAADAGWVQVRHADGATGFVRLGQVWGG